MGTRHLICVVKDNQFKVAQYGQWDGYPSGQGQKIVNFLLSKKFNIIQFLKQLTKIKVLTNEEVSKRWAETTGRTDGFATMDEADRFTNKWPHLERGFGANVLNYIQTAEEPETVLSTEFAGDSLFCEWAYVLNLDNNTLEVYKGFNKQKVPSAQRFAFLNEQPQPAHIEKKEYYPVRLKKIFKLEDLTPDSMGNLEKAISNKKKC